jgi:DNA-binding NarL/FixJ family response regulator
MPTPREKRYARQVTDEAEDAICVALIEDDDWLRAKLVSLLERSKEFRCVGAYAKAEDALANLIAAKPHVVVSDINLPGKSGIECVRQLKIRAPQIQFLMLTVYEDAEQIFESLKAGATGYLLKRTAAAEILEAIRDIHRGGVPMTGMIARKVLDTFKPLTPAPQADATASLTVREREILQGLSGGFAYKEIADRCGISVGTVRTHVEHIYQKLQVRNRTEAVVKYLGNQAGQPGPAGK